MNPSDAGKKGYEKTGHILREKWEEKSRNARETYESDPKICPACNEVIPYEKRRNNFCSQSCSASYNNQGVLRVKTTNPKNCASCGHPKEKRHNKYCDTCIEAGVYVNKITDWENAKDDRVRKRILLEVRGHQCESCDLSTWLEHPIPLELHHVDGNADNSDESNLILICPNCHALTDNYKGANMGVDSSR
jgi:hypothetical protein